jgi:hypothetical membrane protein
LNATWRNDRFTPLLLRAGIAIPFLYYGLQLLAASFDHDYSFIHNVASELGAISAPNARLFNLGIIVQGLITLAAAPGFWQGMMRVRVKTLLASLTAIAIVINGTQSIWAGIFPLPDPRHGGNALFIVATLAIPFLLAISLWGTAPRWLRIILLLAMAMIVVMAIIMSGLTGIDTITYRGILQRLLTLAIFPPLGLVAYYLQHRFVQKDTLADRP